MMAGKPRPTPSQAAVEGGGAEGTCYTARELSGGVFMKKKAFLVQEDSQKHVSIHSSNKRVGITLSHCGFELWSSSEGPDD